MPLGLVYCYYRHLDFSGNRLGSIPPGCFDSLGELRELLLGGNQLSTLPLSVGHCPALLVLEIHENRLATVPTSETIMNRPPPPPPPPSHTHIGRDVLHVVMSCMSTCRVVLVIGSFGCMTHLSLHSNLLTELPASIRYYMLHA